MSHTTKSCYRTESDTTMEGAVASNAGALTGRDGVARINEDYSCYVQVEGGEGEWKWDALGDEDGRVCIVCVCGYATVTD